jgi:CxxC motif-containing protein (DUF1111 family)
MWSRRAAYASLLGLATALLVMLAMGSNPPGGFGDPLPGLDAGLVARFQAGKQAFEEEEVAADGLGPVFNGKSCVSCHAQTATGGGSDLLETRFGLVSDGVFDPLTQLGGSLIQSQGIGLFGGTNFVGEVVPGEANVVARRRTTPLFGLGLVDAVPDDTLEQIASYQQSHLPSTAGRVNAVLDVASGKPRIGRFGWKCQDATLATFAGDAYVNEMGVTTPMFPDENCPQGDCSKLVDNPAPEPTNDATNATLDEFTDFMTFLAPPPHLHRSKDAKAGSILFAQIGCADCHVPALQTGPSAVAAFDRVTFFPFSDFLLHDMGSLGDGIVQGDAGGREMRTAPLWGVRMLTSFLHDGRAGTLPDAILAHDGQGEAAKNRFADLSATQQNQLVAFLKSL